MIKIAHKKKQKDDCTRTAFLPFVMKIMLSGMPPTSYVLPEHVIVG